MRLLLDTHILLWWFSDDPALPVSAKAAIADPKSEVFVSAASVWEISIKRALGRLEFPVEQFGVLIKDAGFLPLSMDVDHCALAGALPLHHQDPFDRMLIAQAQYEGLTLVTLDSMIRRYGVAILGG